MSQFQKALIIEGVDAARKNEHVIEKTWLKALGMERERVY